MEDQVPFKVFVFWNGDTKPEVRRFGIDKTVVTNFHYLNAKLQEIYPGLKRKTYSVKWTDEDGDDIVVSSDEELLTALTALQSSIVKLKVHVIIEENKDNPQDDEVEIIVSAVADNPHVGPCPDTHYGVKCDGCNSNVVGFRYKCISCDDFDLCATCEAAGHHPEHCMVRVPSPKMPRELIKAAIKRSRHFFKTVVSTPNEHKRHRRDRSGDRKHHGDRHHGDRHHGDQHHRDHHHRRPRASWLDTFTTYMNEFANLAGDVGLDTNEAKTPQCKPQQTQEKPQAATSNTQVPPQPEAAAASGSATECPFMPGVEDIPKLIEMYFSGTLGPLIQQFAQQAQQAQGQQAQTQQAQQPSAASANPQPSTSKDDDVVMDEPASKPQEADATSVKSSSSASSSSSESVKNVFAERAEGWTIINKDKDLSEADIVSTPAAVPEPIGFNLPQEFQNNVTINGKQNVYPPLNVATAEPERPQLQEPLKPQPAPIPTASAPIETPNHPQMPQRAAAYPQPQPNTGAYPQPQAGGYPFPGVYPQPRGVPLHSKPHIAAALQQMLNMGFTNEGGWLTQLLENTNGNISAVMDLLTPVKPT